MVNKRGGRSGDRRGGSRCRSILLPTLMGMLVVLE